MFWLSVLQKNPFPFLPIGLPRLTRLETSLPLQLLRKNRNRQQSSPLQRLWTSHFPHLEPLNFQPHFLPLSLMQRLFPTLSAGLASTGVHGGLERYVISHHEAPLLHLRSAASCLPWVFWLACSRYILLDFLRRAMLHDTISRIHFRKRC